MPFLILFVIIPLAEVYAFINVGEEIGVFKTLLLCVITAVIGGALVKFQGLQTIFKARQSFMGGKMPVAELFDGLCLVIAGALLLTPGFVTDIIGFSLLVPPFRQILRQLLTRYGKFKLHIPQNINPSPSARTAQEDIIEGDYEYVAQKHDKPQEKLDQDDKSQ